MIKHLVRLLGVMAAIHLTYVALTYLAGCAAVKEALLGPDPVVNPTDDAEIFSCGLRAKVDYDMSEAGPACKSYEACQIWDGCIVDAGLRPERGMCTDAGLACQAELNAPKDGGK